ncbi:MAG: hypothetical protein A2V70_13820 [Planctomycetes bacterium RBG_13_63_9]|nr:MAG: hypothetical protein A2V70_13820 [Planctomycetes bacterium RBG_13_63_9]
MGEDQVELKKLVIQFRYKPTLKVFTRMDDIGLSLEKDYPDWVRNPLALELRNRQKHRRLVIQHTQSGFDCDGPQDPSAELEVARRSLKKVSDGLALSRFARFGMRSKFVVPSEDEFEDLVASVHQRFCAPIAGIPAFEGMTLADTAFVVNVARKEWTYNINLGPMSSEQWFTLVRYNRDAFQDEPDGETFEKFRRTIPERFIFVDVDVSRTDVSTDEVLRVFQANYKRSAELARGLIEYYRSEQR